MSNEREFGFDHIKTEVASRWQKKNVKWTVVYAREGLAEVLIYDSCGDN